MPLLFCIGLLGFSFLVYYPHVLDRTLLPRFLSTSFFIGVLSVFVLAKSHEIKWPPLSLPLLLLISYFLFASSSTFWANNFSEAIFENQKIFLGVAVFYVVTLLAINYPKFERYVCFSAMLLTLIAFGLAVSQYLNISVLNKESIYSIVGFSGHKNLFSTSLFLLLILNAISIVKLGGRYRVMAIFALLLSLTFIVLLQTRSTYLAVAISVLSFLILNRQLILRQFSFKALGVALASIIVVVGLSFIVVAQKGGLQQLVTKLNVSNYLQSETAKERITLWDKTICTFKKSPVVGVGSGNWQTAFGDCTVHGLYSVELDYTTFQRPHNDFLWVLAENGIIGFLLFISFFIALLIAGLQILKKHDHRPNHIATSLRLSGIYGFMLISCLSFPKERIDSMILFMVIAGFLNSWSQKNFLNLNQKRLGQLILTFGILLACFNIYIGVERARGEMHMKDLYLLKQKNDWSKVLMAAEKAKSSFYSIDPTSIPIEWYEGTANFSLGKNAEALENFLAAKDKAPFNQFVNNDLGSAYEVNGQRDQAKKHYLESIRISPLFDDPRLNLATIFYNEGDYQEALDWANSIRDHKRKMHYRKIIERKIESDN